MALALAQKKKAFAVGLLVLILITGVVCGLRSAERTRHPNRFLIPSGYVGWIIIEHGVKGAPPTKREGGYLVYRFPPNGRVKTSSPLELGIEQGKTQDEAYYVASNSLTPIPDAWPAKHTASEVLIWDWGTGGAIPEDGIPLIEADFIGTESQHTQAERGLGPKSEEEQARDDALAVQDKADQARAAKAR